MFYSPGLIFPSSLGKLKRNAPPVLGSPGPFQEPSPILILDGLQRRRQLLGQHCILWAARKGAHLAAADCAGGPLPKPAGLAGLVWKLTIRNSGFCSRPGPSGPLGFMRYLDKKLLSPWRLRETLPKASRKCAQTLPVDSQLCKMFLLSLLCLTSQLELRKANRKLPI